MKTVVSERGQITVPKRIRDQMGLKPGVELDMQLVRGGFVARKRVERSPWRDAVGVLKRRGGTDSLVDDMRGTPDAAGSRR